MQRQLAPDLAINREDFSEAKAVVDAFFISPADQVEIGERMTDDFEMRRRQLLDRHLEAVDVFADRSELAMKLVIIAAFFTPPRLRPGTALFAEEKQQLEFLLDFELALDLVDFQKKLSAFGL